MTTTSASRVGVSARAGAPTRARRRPRRAWTLVGGALLPLAILGVWQLLSSLQIVPAYLLPAPADVVTAGIDLANRGVLATHVAISTQRVLIGFAAGALVGLVFAAIVGLTRLGDVLLSPTLGGLRAVPSLALVPLLGMYVGINEDSKVILIAIGAFFPVYTTVGNALRHVQPQLVEMGRAFGYTGLRLLPLVQLPSVVPSVVSSLRLSLAQSWLFLVAGELLGASMGLGFLLVDSNNNGRVDRMFLTIILLAVFGKLTDGLVGLLERFLLRRWG